MLSRESEDEAKQITQIAALNTKKIVLIATLLLVAIIFIAKENYINLMVEHFNELDVPDKDVGFQQALWKDTAFYEFGDLVNVVYISERPSGLVFLFHMEDQEQDPLLEIRTIEELNEFQKHALRSSSGTILGKDYANVDVLESYIHIKGLPWRIIAKTDMVKIQAPFIRHVSMILALIIICFLSGFFVLRRLNRTYLQNFKSQAERNNELINTSSNVIYTLDINNHRPTYISGNVKYLVGHNANEIISNSEYWSEHIHPDDLLEFQLRMSRLYKEDKVVFEYRLRNNKGDYIWIQNITRILKNKKDETIEIIGSWVDVTYLKQAESEIKDQKDYSENLLQNLSSPTFIIDPNHIVLFWNKACEELTGLPAKKVVGTN